jgi:D-proline reductase (dithiol) PrdB
LVARALEQAGVPTVEIATNRGPTGLVMPPRVLFTPHERGKNLGTPGASDLQRAIVLAALRLLETAREPFSTVDWQPETAAA